MKIPTIQSEPRKPAGSRAAWRLRRAGKLPAVVYGHKQDPVAITLSAHDMSLHLQHGAHLLNVELAGATQPCLIKDAQYDHLGSALVHVDLARVDLNELVKVHVPVELRGTPKGIADGGVLRQDMMEIEIECLVTHIPEVIRLNVADLALNQVLYVKDVTLDAGLRATNDPEAVVATVRLPQIKVETPAAEGATPTSTEPEVIAKGKVLEEGEAAEAAPEKSKEKEKK